LQLLRRDITVAIVRKADVVRIPHFGSDEPEAGDLGRQGVEVRSAPQSAQSKKGRQLRRPLFSSPWSIRCLKFISQAGPDYLQRNRCARS
jgi:hypothetical protein